MINKNILKNNKKMFKITIKIKCSHINKILTMKILKCTKILFNQFYKLSKVKEIMMGNKSFSITVKKYKNF